MTEIKKSRKKSLEVFKDFGKKKSPLQKSPSHSQNKPHGRRCYYCFAGKQGNRDVSIRNMADSRVCFKIIVEGSFNIVVQQHKVNISLENLKEVPFTNNSKLVPLASMTLIHAVVRKLFTEEVPMYSGRKALSVCIKVEKILGDQELLSILNGYQIPFTNFPV